MVRIPVPVEDKVLEEEDEVKAEADGGEAELGEVPGERGPVLTVVRHEDHLEQTGEAPAHVQQDVSHTPTLGALVAVVCHHLRDELDESYEELHIGEQIEKRQPVGDLGQGEAEAGEDEDCLETEEEAALPGDPLILRLHKDTLSQGEGGGQEGVDTEDDVIELDWENTVGVEGEVFGLNAGVEEHFDIEDAVKTKPEDIQDHEVHVEPLHAGPLEVEDDLGVEGDGPEHEVDPADEMDQILDEVRLDDVDGDGGGGGVDHRGLRCG